MSFPHFDVFISLWRMAEPKLGASCCFLSFWSFMTKSILSLDIDKQYLHKVSFENTTATGNFLISRALHVPALWSTWAHQKNGLFLFLFLNLDTVLSDLTPKNFANIWQIKWNRIRSIKFETMSKQCELRGPTQTVWPLWCLNLEEMYSDIEKIFIIII